MNNPDRGEVIAQLVSVILIFVVIFLICECGQIVTIQFEIFNDTLNRCKWYYMPIELQQMLVVVMVGAQHSTQFQGYGNVECTCESFKKVVRIKSFEIEKKRFPFNIFRSSSSLDNSWRVFIFYDAPANGRIGTCY